MIVGSLRMSTGSSYNFLQLLVALSSKISLDKNLYEDDFFIFYGLFHWFQKAPISLATLFFHSLSSKNSPGVHLVNIP